MGTVPGGEIQRLLLQGGTEYGNLTLTRFYALHVFVLPLGLAGLLAVHLSLLRKHGVTPPVLPEAEFEKRMQRFFPSQLLLDVGAMAVTAAVLVVLTLTTHGADLYAPAQPASNFVARPEWYFLFLFQILKYFDGPLQIIGTVVLPGAAATFLLLLPWLDRAQSRKAGERMPVLAAVGLLMAGVATLTALALVEDGRNVKYQKGLAEAHRDAERSRELAKMGVLPAGGDAVYENDPQVRTRRLFTEHCTTCHSLDGVGGSEAPSLTGYKNREWLSSLIRNPRDVRFFGGTKTHEDMPSFPPSERPDDKLAQVVEYVTSLMGPEAGPVNGALAEQGKALWDGGLNCSDCHEVKAGESGDGPNLAGHGSRDWIERIIRDSGAPDLFGKSASMPKFRQKLSEEEIKALAELIVGQRVHKGDG
jgi:ubiquinol-cytochrome c reductase cytochrome b subunit